MLLVSNHFSLGIVIIIKEEYLKKSYGQKVAMILLTCYLSQQNLFLPESIRLYINNLTLGCLQYNFLVTIKIHYHNNMSFHL